MPRRPDRDRGFTLIEMVASLGLLALIAVLIVQGLGTGRRVWERAAGRGSAVEVIADAQGTIRGTLGRSYPGTQAGGAAADFDGQAERVDFLAPPRDAAGAGPMLRHALHLGANGTLVLEAAGDLGGAGQATTLMTGVARMNIAYFGRLAGEPAARWHERWQQAGDLPQLVRIDAALAPGQRAWWPPLVIAVAARVDTSCHLDADTGLCRRWR